MAIPETTDLPIGSHISVPLKLSDGHVYGTFCCFSFSPDITLNQRDLQMMKAFAEMISHQIEADLQNARRSSEMRNRIEAQIENGGPAIVFQPVYSLAGNRLLGAEALSRFTGEPVRSPDKWFGEAADIGLRVQLELQAMENALESYRSAWSIRDFHLALNSSPQTILEGQIGGLLHGFPCDRIVLEITEHDHVESYDTLRKALRPLQDMGVRIAVDDAGSGYASMRHILNLKPDVIKLDVSLTRDINTDPLKRALASALIAFGNETDSKVVAEGIETDQELEVLRTLGAHSAQGYFLGKPAAIADFCGLARSETDRTALPPRSRNG